MNVSPEFMCVCTLLSLLSHSPSMFKFVRVFCFFCWINVLTFLQKRQNLDIPVACERSATHTRPCGRVVGCQSTSADGLKVYLVCGWYFVDDLATLLTSDEHIKHLDPSMTLIYDQVWGSCKFRELPGRNNSTGDSWWIRTDVASDRIKKSKWLPWRTKWEELELFTACLICSTAPTCLSASP